MKVRWLTPEERHEIDPTGLARGYLASLTRDRREDLPKHLKCTAPTEFILNYSRLVRQHAPDSYASIISDHDSKIGRQGGTFPLKELKKLVLPYYTAADERSSIQVTPELLEARDYLIRRILRRKRECGIHYWDFRSAGKHTYSGLPVCGKRGTFDAETVGVVPGWSHAHYTIPGERYMRNAPRSIFMLANPDFRKVERDLTVARNWLKSQFPEYFGAWLRPDIVVEPTFREALSARWWSNEEDYVKMDTTVSWELIRDLILPIYEALLGKGRYLQFACYIEESFHTGLYWGDEVWDGKHTLFSGLPYTNDFETLISVLLTLAAVRRFSLTKWRFVALGDDLTFLFKGGKKLAAEIHRFQLYHATQIGMVLHDDEKFRSTPHDIRFCRKVYSLDIYGGSVGAYPSTLALNNILQPEVLQDSVAKAIGADLQRLDGVQWSPDYHSILDIYWSFLTDEGRETFLKASDVELRTEQDWWDMLYGTTWMPSSSVSYQILKQKSQH